MGGWEGKGKSEWEKERARREGVEERARREGEKERARREGVEGHLQASTEARPSHDLQMVKECMLLSTSHCIQHRYS